MTPTKTKAILRITAYGKQNLRVNYSRRMYAIMRRYAPDVVEGDRNECYADITGLRTFFKMTYAEIAEEMKQALAKEIGIRFMLHVATEDAFRKAKRVSKKTPLISTYKEMNSHFFGYPASAKRAAAPARKARVRFTVPFIGRVS